MNIIKFTNFALGTRFHCLSDKQFTELCQLYIQEDDDFAQLMLEIYFRYNLTEREVKSIYDFQVTKLLQLYLESASQRVWPALEQKALLQKAPEVYFTMYCQKTNQCKPAFSTSIEIYMLENKELYRDKVKQWIKNCRLTPATEDRLGHLVIEEPTEASDDLSYYNLLKEYLSGGHAKGAMSDAIWFEYLPQDLVFLLLRRFNLKKAPDDKIVSALERRCQRSEDYSLLRYLLAVSYADCLLKMSEQQLRLHFPKFQSLMLALQICRERKELSRQEQKCKFCLGAGKMLDTERATIRKFRQLPKTSQIRQTFINQELLKYFSEKLVTLSFMAWMLYEFPELETEIGLLCDKHIQRIMTPAQRQKEIFESYVFVEPPLF